MVVSHEQLIAEDRGKHLGLVVVEAAVPRVLIQLERRLEPDG